jgi:hypothetical protein
LVIPLRLSKYYHNSGEITGKGLWLVGDQGVYLMPNTDGKTRTIAYARECDPTKLEFDEW